MGGGRSRRRGGVNSNTCTPKFPIGRGADGYFWLHVQKFSEKAIFFTFFSPQKISIWSFVSSLYLCNLLTTPKYFVENSDPRFFKLSIHLEVRDNLSFSINVNELINLLRIQPTTTVASLLFTHFPGKAIHTEIQKHLKPTIQ